MVSPPSGSTDDMLDITTHDTWLMIGHVQLHTHEQQTMPQITPKHTDVIGEASLALG